MERKFTKKRVAKTENHLKKMVIIIPLVAGAVMVLVGVQGLRACPSLRGRRSIIRISRSCKNV